MYLIPWSTTSRDRTAVPAVDAVLLFGGRFHDWSNFSSRDPAPPSWSSSVLSRYGDFLGILGPIVQFEQLYHVHRRVL